LDPKGGEVSVRALRLRLTAGLLAGWVSAGAQSPSPPVSAGKAGKVSAAKPRATAGKGRSATARAAGPASGAKAAAAGKSPAGKVASGKSRARRLKHPVRRAGQLAPTRERYAQIQQALIERGYSEGPASGIWGPEWTECLKRFQRDHNLESSGKLNSLTLIALGLGPNRSSRSGLPAGGPDGETSSGRSP